MSQLVPFNSHELDIDLMELNGWELSQIKKRTGYSYQGLLDALKELDGDAIRVLFWVAELRHNPELKFDAYRGPKISFFMEHLSNLVPADVAAEVEGELGKAEGETETPSIETTGSQPSPSSSTASTELSTTV